MYIKINSFKKVRNCPDITALTIHLMIMVIGHGFGVKREEVFWLSDFLFLMFETFREIWRFSEIWIPPSDDMPQVWQTQIGPFPLPLPPPPHHNRKKIIKCLKVWRNTVCHIWEILHEKTMIPLPPPTNHNRKKINKSHKSLLKILCQAITFTQLKQYKFHNLLQISKHRPPFDTSYGK